MERRHCQDHTATAKVITKKQEERRREIRNNILAVLGLIAFFVVYCIVGTMEYNSLYPAN